MDTAGISCGWGIGAPVSRGIGVSPDVADRACPIGLARLDRFANFHPVCRAGLSGFGSLASLGRISLAPASLASDAGIAGRLYQTARVSPVTDGIALRGRPVQHRKIGLLDQFRHSGRGDQSLQRDRISASMDRFVLPSRPRPLPVGPLRLLFVDFSVWWWAWDVRMYGRPVVHWCFARWQQ